MEYIAFDVHKHYTWALVEDERGRIKREGKIPMPAVRCGSSSKVVSRARGWR